VAVFPNFDSALWHFKQDLAQSIEHLYNWAFPYLDVNDIGWRRFQIKVEDLVSAEPADDVYFTWDIVNFTGGTIDTSWTDSDYGSATDALGTFITTLVPRVATKYRFAEVKAYVMGFNPEWPGSSPTNKDIHPFLHSGAPDYVRIIGINGSDSSGALPPQVSSTITELVPTRANWGRQYFPGLARAQLDEVSGRWKTSTSGTLSLALHDAYAALQNIELYPCVPTTSYNKQRVAALQNITNVRCDDVPDVQRRRRFRHAIYVDTRPALPTATTWPAQESPA
jgi:hypothetical protein